MNRLIEIPMSTITEVAIRRSRYSRTTHPLFAAVPASHRTHAAGASVSSRRPEHHTGRPQVTHGNQAAEGQSGGVSKERGVLPCKTGVGGTSREALVRFRGTAGKQRLGA